MTLSLPAPPPVERSIARVVPRILASLRGESGALPPARSAIVVLVDGLGKANLSSRRAYARFLASALGPKDSAVSVTPTTTAAALTSLLTGALPGEHGIVGYSARIPGTDIIANGLHGWEDHGLDPRTYQRVVPIFQRESEAGRPCFVVSLPGYRGTGFTEATARGAVFHPAGSLRERAAIAGDLAQAHPGALIYLYIPELDKIGHAEGSESDAWARALEDVDGVLSELERFAGAQTGIIVTADHGMVDVPRDRHRLLGRGDERLEGVRLIGGEPRMLQLYTDPNDTSDVVERFRRIEGDRAWVFTREEAIEAGLFGPVAAEVRDRIGDVLVAARKAVAYYDDRLENKRAQGMIGQHGSLTDAERVVPVVPARRVSSLMPAPFSDVSGKNAQASSVRAPNTISSHEGIDVRPFRFGVSASVAPRSAAARSAASVSAGSGVASTTSGSSVSNSATGPFCSAGASVGIGSRWPRRRRRASSRSAVWAGVSCAGACLIAAAWTAGADASRRS